ncbi:hypothetical protein AWC38_SpisGene8945 [Stylophora pistillata]|uniref:Uncharacterized protein n=1 Tax=Stylophora pistillata TaxID=50429 RepID=A0A2B4SCV8_STYPI|nr:hypothetical protein AWC38_SpisGene8945 [Stylophora pistillata]
MTVVSRRLKDFDFKSFDDMINSSGLLEENTSLQSLITRYDVVLPENIDKLAPIKSLTEVDRPNVPWYNEDIAFHKRIRRRLERKWRSTRLDHDKTNYLRQCLVELVGSMYSVLQQVFQQLPCTLDILIRATANRHGLEQVKDHNNGSEEDYEVNDPRKGEVSEDYANKMPWRMDDTVDYQDDNDAKSGPDSIVDDAGDRI